MTNFTDSLHLLNLVSDQNMLKHVFSIRDLIKNLLPKWTLKSNQGNQDSSGIQKNIIEEQRPDMENKHNKEHKITKIIHAK